MPKVSAIQMTSSHVLNDNLAKAALLIKQAAKDGSQLVVLPEMFPLAGHKATDKVNIREEYGNGPIQDFLSTQAKQNNIWIVGGTIPISCDSPDKIRAACLVYDDQGKVVARYDKIHLFDVCITQTEKYSESKTTEAGSDIIVIDSPIGKLGLAVCYDIRFPELFSALVNKGAEIIVIPTAFTVKTGQAHWEVLTRARAIETQCYLVGSCQAEKHSNGRETYGHSLIIDPWGEIKTCLPKGEGIISADIDLESLHKVRTDMPIRKGNESDPAKPLAFANK